ncbi:MAG: AzlD domain-containing protein [Syntrophomonadaceae bacterium]|jgi:branched-subunit amino acid transport protein|nr:AzlD domain-containing protein [Syntrophomonadaceae bacterium]
MRAEILLIIVGMALATAIPRCLPVALLSRFEFPEKLKEWLSYIAPAVLAALVAVSVLAPDGTIAVTMGNRYIWAFIPTLLVAVYTRSPFYTLVTGIAVMAVLYNFW